jgi:NAD(P)-dependent dehydrogenase (short-subunit alcohol dehydrogenase family)
VTGGGSGIGKATSQRFAEEGAMVIVTDIDLGSAQRVSSSIVEKGGASEAYLQDVTDEARWEELLGQIVDQQGHLDVLANNAGIVLPGNAEEATLADWQRTQSVNLDSVFLGTRAAIRAMKGRGGSIINISSIEGIVGEPTAAAYNASKGGVRIFTKSAALHCAISGYGVRVNSIHPGFIQTPMVENAAAQLDDSFLDQVIAAIPLGELGAPMDIANGALFLASDESSYMTGSELVIDGGFTAR